MHCPVCVSEETKVVDSRLVEGGHSIRRRRECISCAYRFSTFEEVEMLDLMVVKRDGARQQYDRAKLERGLRKALEKRAYTPEQFRALTAGIERDIQKRKLNEIASGDIGDIVMHHLKGFDKVAYVRFASVYRSFADVETFQRELNKIAVS
jgi:transcriptional repressor NrdR